MSMRETKPSGWLGEILKVVGESQSGEFFQGLEKKWGMVVALIFGRSVGRGKCHLGLKFHKLFTLSLKKVSKSE